MDDGTADDNRQAFAICTSMYDDAKAIHLDDEEEENEKQDALKLTNQRARLRVGSPEFPGETCGFCTFFTGPDTCEIVVGPVAPELLCDWIQSREVEEAIQYEVSDDDWLAFVAGMAETQPYQHIVQDGALTPAGPLVMIKDTSDPPHFFSLSKEFHVDHTTLEHHWSQDTVDELIGIGEVVMRRGLKQATIATAPGLFGAGGLFSTPGITDGDEEEEDEDKRRHNTLANLLSAKLHEAFTTAADQIAIRGYLDQPQRIEISSAIGDMLRNFNSKLDPELAAMVIDATDVHDIANKAGLEAVEADQLMFFAEKLPPGLYLADPHGPLIWDTKKTAVAKGAPAELAGEWVLVGPGFAGAADPGKAYGLVTLSEAEKVTLADFDERFEQHRVTKAERKRWWKEASHLYLHHIKAFERWNPPREVRVPQNVRHEIPELEFTGNLAYVYRRPAKDTVLAKNAVTLAGGGQHIEVVISPELEDYDSRILEALPEHTTGDLTIADKATNGKAQPVADLVLRWRRGALVDDSVEVEKMDKAAHSPFKTVDGVQLSAEDFASVGDAQEPGTWKLPLTKTAGGVDATRIAAAITAMQPGGFRGQRVELTAPKGKVVSRISRAIGKLEDEDAQERLRGRLADVKAGRRISRERAGVLRTVRDELSHLIEKVGDMVGWADYDDQKPWVPFRAVKTYTDAEGNKGIVVWTTNAFVDKDGEIFTTKSIEDYVSRHTSEEDKGEFWFWHIPGSKFATIKAQGMVGRFLVEAGPFDDTKVGQAFQRFFDENPNGHPDIAPEGWGASHGYMFDPEDRKDGVYEWFEKRESSVLPGSVAANPHNPSMEVFDVDAKQEAAFRKVVGDDVLVDSLIATGAKLSDVLEADGVDHKQRASSSEDAKDEDAREAEAEQEESESEANGDGDADARNSDGEEAEAVKGYSDVVTQLEDQGEAIKIIATQIGTLTDTMQALVATDDERIDQKLKDTPAASLQERVARSVKGSSEARIRKDSKLAKSGPEEKDPIPEGGGMGIPVLDRIKALNTQQGRGGG